MVETQFFLSSKEYNQSAVSKWLLYCLTEYVICLFFSRKGFPSSALGDLDKVWEIRMMLDGKAV